MKLFLQWCMLPTLVLGFDGGSVACELELVDSIHLPDLLEEAGLAENGFQGIHIFDDKPNKAYICSAFGLGLVEVDLEARSLELHTLRTATDPTQIFHTPDDVTGLPGDSALYYTNLVSLDIALVSQGNGFCSKCYGGVYKVETEGPNAWEAQVVWEGQEGIDLFVNPIATDGEFLYTATSLGVKTTSFGIPVGPNKTFAPSNPEDLPNYPRKIYKLTTSGQLLWEKELPFYVNAFDIREGWIYAGASTGGGAHETVTSFKGNISLVRINTDNGEWEELLASPRLPQTYITAAKFAGDKLLFQTDKVWALDWDAESSNVNTSSLRVVYDLAADGFHIVTLSAFNSGGTNTELDYGQVMDNAIPHPDGKHYFISGAEDLFKFRIVSAQALDESGWTDVCVMDTGGDECLYDELVVQYGGCVDGSYAGYYQDTCCVTCGCKDLTLEECGEQAADPVIDESGYVGDVCYQDKPTEDCSYEELVVKYGGCVDGSYAGYYQDTCCVTCGCKDKTLAECSVEAVDPCGGLCSEGTSCDASSNTCIASCDSDTTDCCASDTCSSDALRACVGVIDPYCLTSWDMQCVSEAKEICYLQCSA